MADLGAEALIEAIRQIHSGAAQYIKQDESEATYAPMIDKSEAAVDFSQSAKTVKNLIMGMNPSPGAFIEVDGQRLKLHEASLGDSTLLQPGVISEITADGIAVSCGDGFSVIIKTIQKQGKNKTDAYSYACGAKLKAGDYLK